MTRTRSALAAAALAGLAAVVGLSQAPRPAAAQPPAAATLPPDLALVPGDALGFVHVRLADIWKQDSLKEYRDIFRRAGPKALASLDEQFVPAPSTIDRVTAVLLSLDPQQGNPAFAAIARFSAPFDPAKVRAAYFTDARVKQAGGKEYYVDDKTKAAVYFPDPSTLVLSDEKGVAAFLAMPAGSGGRLSKAVALAASGPHLTAAANVKGLPIPPDAVEQIPPELRPLAKLDTVTVTLELKQSATLTARLGYPGDAEAEQAEVALKRAAGMARQMLAQPRQEAEAILADAKPGVPRPLEDLPKAVAAVAGLGALNLVDEILANPPVAREGANLTATATLPNWATPYLGMSTVSVGLLLPAVQKVREAAARTQGQNNMKQIGLAMHNYHDTYGKFPPASVVDKKGKRLLSWRVLILPYIEQDNLFKQFKLDEPWDSEHNKKLIALMPKIYDDPRAPSPAASGLTHYKVFVGKGAGFDWIKGGTFQNITDGTSNTIMTVAGGDPVVWTKPDDIEFDPEKALPDLTKPFGPMLMVGMFDGSVRMINLAGKDMDKLLKRGSSRRTAAR
ncbi:MAG: DUF1559 domain-containing protein [Gemmataceae bacterium]